MLRLSGAPQRFAWGTVDAIPKLINQPSDGQPYAEYWLGAYPLAPAVSDAGPLHEYIAANPQVLGRKSELSFGAQLPFLMKVLSAAHPLSLQAHPDRGLAVEGYARENALGIPLDDPSRSYKDAWPKPELLVAVSPFETLTGFRPPEQTAELFEGLGLNRDLASVIGPLRERKGAAAIAEVFLDALSLNGDRQHLMDVSAAAFVKHVKDPGPVGEFARTALRLDDVFPGDGAILAALLLNRITLRPGEAVFIKPGTMHVHLSGTGVEVMANSDNVVRGGLTRKHIDVTELVRVVDFEPVTPQIIQPELVEPGVETYPVDVEEFTVWRLQLSPDYGRVTLPGEGSARILFVVAGSASVSTGPETNTLAHGEAVFLGADETDVRISGDATAFVSASGLR
ncbi:MAG: mannose-6-phosphate isomerase, class I [Propionibacteriaceae bacterium]|jgi:mannose-6-phosphate isomerase|nr:mannose-6-phosphate isomerase, class I [Propionibacteriaceae bacterium]